MKLRKAEHKKTIIDEFRFSAKKIREVQSLDQKLFYFSITFATVSRIFNSEFNSQLVLAHLVMSGAHGAILARANALKAGDFAVTIEENFFEKLAFQVEEIANLIEKGEDIYLPLEKIALMTYATTGNGFYLLQRGVLSI